MINRLDIDQILECWNLLWKYADEIKLRLPTGCCPWVYNDKHDEVKFAEKLLDWGRHQDPDYSEDNDE